MCIFGKPKMHPFLVAHRDIVERQRIRFEAVEKMIEMTASGRAGALIVSGPPGVGKTHLAMEYSSSKNKGKFGVLKGHVSATGLYTMLYQHRDKNDVVLIDDSDAALKEEISLNILKAALDTSKTRLVTWRSRTRLQDDDGEDVPTQFQFEGSVIFLTNLRFDQIADEGKKSSEHIEAILSRSHYIDMGITTPLEKLVRVIDVSESGNLTKSLNKKQKAAVYEYMMTNVDSIREISVRSLLKLVDIVNQSPKGWKDLADISMIRNSHRED